MAFPLKHSVSARLIKQELCRSFALKWSTETPAHRAMAGRNFTDACGAERPPDPAQPGCIPAFLMAAAASGRSGISQRLGGIRRDCGAVQGGG
jgi:hypothetical protein